MAALELDYIFDGSIHTFVEAIQNGRAFNVDGCPTPVPDVIPQGKIIIAQLMNRTLIIDLNLAFKRLKIHSPVRLKMRFE